MGSVPNVGLMAQKAEEYGSHDKTFEIAAPGTVRVVDAASGDVLLEHDVGTGDIWRACQTKDVADPDWVKLAVTRARATGTPAVFWLDDDRAHDGQLIAKVERYLDDHDTDGPRHPDPGAGRGHPLLPRAHPPGRGHHLGHRQRPARLPHRPLPDPRARHQRQDALDRAAHERRRPLRDRRRRLGPEARAAIRRRELPALGHPRRIPRPRRCRFEHLATTTGNAAAQVLADTLDEATGKFLEEDRSPARKVGEIDNRGSHFYLALYWAEALAAQTADAATAARFAPLAERLAADEATIVGELLAVQGHPVDIGGYYRPDPALTSAVMRPSATFNEALASL